MSDLITLIRDSRKSRSELIATTVRISKELQSVIEELSEFLGISKQDVMLKLLEEGAKVAEDEISGHEDAESDLASSTFHVLNTNKRHDIHDTAEMISKGIAAAFYGHWKLNIEKLKKGDVVFLYENGVGVVAYGTASGDTLKKDRYGDKDECYYQVLSDFHVLNQPLKAADIKKILGRNVVFLRTRSGMPDGQKLLSFIADVERK